MPLDVRFWLFLAGYSKTSNKHSHQWRRYGAPTSISLCCTHIFNIVWEYKEKEILKNMSVHQGCTADTLASVQAGTLGPPWQHWAPPYVHDMHIPTLSPNMTHTQYFHAASLFNKITFTLPKSCRTAIYASKSICHHPKATESFASHLWHCQEQKNLHQKHFMKYYNLEELILGPVGIVD